MLCTGRQHDDRRDYPARRPGTRRALRLRVCLWLLVPILLQRGRLPAESIPVRYPEGTTHGFLALRTLEGKLLAAGDQTEVIHGNQVVSHLIYRFKDGSVDDERTVFSQRGTFRVISDRHIQKGPSFPRPIDVLINCATSQVTVRYRDKELEKEKTEHLDVPPDLANGIIPYILKNISPDTKETKVSYIGTDPKPRLVHLSITPDGEDTFSIADAHPKMTLFTVKVEIGGVAGKIAPVIGKKPADTKIWLVREQAPGFVRTDQALYVGGPIWRIQLTGPEWPRAPY